MEVLWTLHTVAKRQSYKSNEDIDELFQTLFPDSDIAKSFKCGKDNMPYIILFGLADFIERDHISKIKDLFVLIFDEILNQTNPKIDLKLYS